jgi:UDP-2-acetamido-2-deoxy-ribo-hexuluronate aminotransferase
MSIPFIDLKSQYAALKSDIDARIAAVLAHGAYIMGPEVRELEEQLASFAGAKHAVAVSSGTDALLVALMADGVGPGDAVFVPALTFTATAEVVLVAGATPVFVDVDPKTCNIDPNDLKLRIEQTIEKGKLKPKAVIVVDLYGLPADYAAINAISETHELLVIDDGAQAFGATLDGKRVGALAPVTATSFFPAKPLGCYGDGGAVFTDDDDQAALFKSIRMHGSGATKYEVVRVGLNARMDTIQAAVLLAKLSVFEKELVAREALATLYDDRMGDTVDAQARIPGTSSAWAQYTVMTDHRDALAAHLKEQGIPTAIYYPSPMHLQTAYREYGGGEGSLPECEHLSHRVLSFPMHPYMDEETANGICDAVLRGLETVSG